LTTNDIRDLLTGFAATIELDQIRVDPLPPEKFHPEYDEGMWRRWRRDHLDYIDQLLPTVDAIPPAILQELTQLAVICRPEIVREALLDVFADAASGSCEQELETAALFFDWVIKDVRDWPDGRAKGARSQMMHWLAVTYPLRPAGRFYQFGSELRPRLYDAIDLPEQLVAQ
jgi:hypothetical protein